MGMDTKDVRYRKKELFIKVGSELTGRPVNRASEFNAVVRELERALTGWLID